MPITPYAFLHHEALQIRLDRLNYLDDWLKASHEQGDIDQVVIKLRCKGYTVLETVWNDEKKKDRLSTETIFPVASVTQAVIATLFCIMQEDGLIDIGELFKFGMPNLSIQKGSKEYCKNICRLLKIVLLQITGMTLDDLAHRYFFEPLGMKNSILISTPERWLDVSRNHANIGSYSHIVSQQDILSASDMGVLLSTANDLSRFADMIHQGGTLDGRRILSPATMKRLCSVYDQETNDQFYNLALCFSNLWFQAASKVFAYSGYVINHGHIWLMIDCDHELTLAVYITPLLSQNNSEVYKRIQNIIYSACY